MSSIVWCTATAVAVALSGCTLSPTRPSLEERQAIRRIAVIPSAQPPKVKFDTFAVGAGSGLAKGAGAGALEVIAASASTGDPFALLIGVILAPVGAVIGGVAGAVVATPPNTARQIEVLQDRKVAELALQRNLGEEVRQILQDAGYTAFLADVPAGAVTAPERTDIQQAPVTADAIMETSATEFGFVGSGNDPDLALFVTGETRLVRTTTGAVLAEPGYRARSAERKLADWQAPESRYLAQAYGEALRLLAEVIVEQALLNYPVAGPLGSRSVLAGPKPVEPGTQEGSLWVVPDVETTTPELTWEPLVPSSEGLRPEHAELAHLESLTYELCVRGKVSLPDDPHGRCIYRRKGLTQTAHRIEEPLHPDTRYWWDVRARFRLDGHDYLSAWSTFPRKFDIPATGPNSSH